MTRHLKPVFLSANPQDFGGRITSFFFKAIDVFILYTFKTHTYGFEIHTHHIMAQTDIQQNTNTQTKLMYIHYNRLHSLNKEKFVSLRACAQ